MAREENLLKRNAQKNLGKKTRCKTNLIKSKRPIVKVQSLVVSSLLLGRKSERLLL